MLKENKVKKIKELCFCGNEIIKVSGNVLCKKCGVFIEKCECSRSKYICKKREDLVSWIKENIDEKLRENFVNDVLKSIIDDCSELFEDE